MNSPVHWLSWLAGWWLVLAGFASGAILGLGFHRPDLLGGYGSFRRRLLRLGHIACAALGMLNLIVALAPFGNRAASVCFVAGGVLMPAVCWLTAWREKCRHLFFLPVTALLVGVALMLGGGNSKSEYRNPKPIRNSNQQPANNSSSLKARFPQLPLFGFVSDFGFRISDFESEGGNL